VPSHVTEAMASAGRSCLGVVPYEPVASVEAGHVGEDLRAGCGTSDDSAGGDGGMGEAFDGLTLSPAAWHGPRVSGKVTHSGLCGYTASEESLTHQQQLCRGGHKGSARMRAASFGIGLERCISFCKSCERCRYLSYSLQADDCSWFHSCNLDHLEEAPSFALDFVSLRVPPLTVS
jgi:hypothetical protein